MLSGTAPVPGPLAGPTGTGSTGSATASSTAPSTPSPSPACAATSPPRPTFSAARPKAKPTAKSAAASSATSPATSTEPSPTAASAALDKHRSVISRQHVHLGSIPQVTVLPHPCPSSWIRTCCGTFLLYRCHPRREPQPCPRQSPDQRQPCTQDYRCTPRRACRQRGHRGPALTIPRNLTPFQPRAGQPDSPTDIRPGIPRVAQQLPLL